ncbi:MAG: CPBP family glutamic-type intramembrane protease [Planctomycetota bacterium]
MTTGVTSLNEAQTRESAAGERVRRGAELLVVFAALPAVIAWTPVRVPLMPLMWLMAAVCLWMLWRDPGFNRRRLWNAAALTRQEGRRVVLRFVGLAALLAALLWVMLGRTVWGMTFPETMFSLPRERTGLWMIIMVGYPLLSVLPQNVVWRVFFFRRYRRLLGDGWGLVAGSALLFGWAHVVMLNGFAVATTLVGGVLFAQTYRRSGSMLLASVEHALYGCWMFTVGYGLLFLYGHVPDSP